LCPAFALAHQKFKTNYMRLSKTLFSIGFFAATIFATAQVKGNYDYRSASNYIAYGTQTVPARYSPIPMQQPGDLSFSIKGLYNVTADSYLAIFSITQVGKTQKETNGLLQNKIDSIRAGMIEMGKKAELYVDMISFVPLYEVASEKKLFSKKTYNEIPIGFELKKNLHFKYTDPQALEALVTLCANQEIYDLVRVDYFIDDIEAKKAELIERAEAQLKSKIARYASLTNETYNDKNRLMSEGFAVHYPVEQYQNYQAYCSNALQYKAGTVVPSQKVVSQFYMPMLNKSFDFVINPSFLAPVVQIEYEIKMKLVQKPVKPQPKPTQVVKTEIQKEVFIVTPNGEVKKLPF
jgi:hypothetical protein